MLPIFIALPFEELNIGMEEKSHKQKIESSILFWFTAIGVPFGISLAITLPLGLSPYIAIPLSALISILVGLIAYIKTLMGEIKDLKEEIKNAKKK